MRDDISRFWAVFLTAGLMLGNLGCGSSHRPEGEREETEREPAAALAYAPQEYGRIDLHTSDSALAACFRWAKKQALAYVFTGDPVGDWYEAALPGREAFCMRDVSHQSDGAQALGLSAFTNNMLRRFAENISESKDWCSYWEINRSNLPAPVDYTSDEAFWYNLPANFDVLDACWRQYLWTGNPAYVEDPVFLNFYDRTVRDYVDRWHLDLDRVMTRQRHMNLDAPPDRDDHHRYYRGIPGYYEVPELRLGADLLAAQYAGYKAYANIQNARGNLESARRFEKLAEELKTFFNRTWWDEENSRFYTFLDLEGEFQALALRMYLTYFGIVEPGAKLRAALDNLLKFRSVNIEVQCHLPEIFYRFGRSAQAYAQLLDLSARDKRRREYPEVSFAVMGAIVTGVMGIEVHATERIVTTLPRLTEATDWAELKGFPIGGDEISVRHEGLRRSVLKNRTDTRLTWIAGFPGEHAVLLVDGLERPAEIGTDAAGNPVSRISVRVDPEQDASVETPAGSLDLSS